MNNADGTVSRVIQRPTRSWLQLSCPAVQSGVAHGSRRWLRMGRVSDALVARIDPSTNTVVARYGLPSGSGSVAADDNAVWISAHDVHKVGGYRSTDLGMPMSRFRRP